VRRKAIHEHVFQSPLSTNLFVKRFIAELDEVNTKPTRVRSLQVNRTDRRERMAAPPMASPKSMSTQDRCGQEKEVRWQQSAEILVASTWGIQL
jgi:hypothetical protein